GQVRPPLAGCGEPPPLRPVRLLAALRRPLPGRGHRQRCRCLREAGTALARTSQAAAAAQRLLLVIGKLIPGGVPRLSLSQDPCSPLLDEVALLARVRTHLRPVDRDRPQTPEPREPPQRQHPSEQPDQRLGVPATETRDRRLIRTNTGADHPHRDVLPAAPLDHTRGTLSSRVRLQQQRHHQRRVARRPPVPVIPTRAAQRRKIETLDSLDHHPRQTIVKKPHPHIRPQQKPLLPRPAHKPLNTHHHSLRTPPHGPGLRDTHRGFSSSSTKRPSEWSTKSSAPASSPLNWVPPLR